MGCLATNRVNEGFMRAVFYIIGSNIQKIENQFHLILSETGGCRRVSFWQCY